MRNLLLILAAFCLVSFWGCSENPTIDDDPTEQTPGGNDNNDKDDDGDETENDGSETPDDSEETETPSVEFEAETDTEPTIEADGGEIEVTFAATAEWTATVTFDNEETRAEAWCTVHPESGEAGTATITIAAEPNESTEERSATIVILCGEESISLTLTQAGTEEKEKESIPNNEIHYTSYDGNVVELYSGYGAIEYPFGEGVSIVSNIYENGQGIITCDGDITTIGDRAFIYCGTLTSITIPNTVTSIGYEAFARCGLTSITIPDNIATIGDWAFYDCESLTSIILSDSVTAIGNRAFCSCYSLTNITIPDSVTTIGDLAFYYCINLTSITIPDSVTTIGYSAFYYCINLTSITIPDSVVSIGHHAFSNCNLTSVTIPNNVTSIGHCSFTVCSNLTAFYGKFASKDNRCLIVDGILNSFAPAGLTSYTIPDDVTTIGDSAFSGYKNLTSITIPNNVTAIGAEAFSYCTGLISIAIPDGVTSIGYQTFYRCTSLKSITIPYSVISIGELAFFDCESLTSIYCKAVTPPSLEDFAFYNTNNAPIYVPEESVEVYKAAEGWSEYADRIYGYDFED